MHKEKKQGILIGIDYGKKRTGISVGNTISKTASSLITIQHNNQYSLLEQLQPIIDEWKPDMIVLGKPGTETSEMYKICHHLQETIIRTLKISCVLYNEELTSWQAQQELGKRIDKSNKHLVDANAAKIILESFMRDYY